MIQRKDGYNVFTLANGSTFTDRLEKPIDELPTEVRAAYAAAADRVIAGKAPTLIKPMCKKLLSLKKLLAAARLGEHGDYLDMIRKHHHTCQCGKVGHTTVDKPDEGWIWEGA